MSAMTSPMDLRTLLLLSLLALTQTMPTNRNKRELVNSDEAESAEFSDSPVQHGPSPKKYESPGDAGNDIVFDAQADLGGEGKGSFKLSLHDHISNITTELVTLVLTEDVNRQSNTEGVRDGLALGTGPSMSTGPGSVSNSQEGNNIKTGVSTESTSQESAEASLLGVTGLGSVSNSASVSLEQSSDSSQVSSESSSSSVSVSVELTSNSIETSAEPLNLSTDPRSEGSLQSITTDLPSDPSTAPTQVSQPEEEEADEDDVDEDDDEEDDEEEVEPPKPTSPLPATFPTGTAVDTSVSPELKDLYSGGVSGEPMLADQSLDMLARTGVSDGKNNMLTAEAALMQLDGGVIDGKNNIVNQAIDFPAADHTSQSHSISVGIVHISQEKAKTKEQSLNTDLPSDPSAASATLSPQPDATTGAPGEEEVDEDELDEDEVEEDNEDKAGSEVVPTIVTPEVTPTISPPPIPDSPTSNAADPVGPPSGIAVGNAPVVSLGKEPQNTGYGLLLDIEGFVGDDPLSYTAAEQVELPNDSLTNKQTLTNVPAELTSVPESLSVSSDSLAFVGVPSDSLQSSPDMQNLNTDPGTAPVNEEATDAVQSDPSAASATQSPQPNATTAAPEEEGDEDDIDEDEVEEDDKDETGGEVTVAPTTSASPAILFFPTGNAVDTSVAPSGLSVDTAVAPQLKDHCTDPGCALEYDQLLDTEGYVGDDPQSYMVDQQKTVSKNPQTDTLTDQQTLIDAPAGLTSELDSALKSANVLSNALVSVEVPSESRQSSSGVQTQMTDSRTALKLEGTAAGQQSLNTDLLSDPSAASATLSPQSDATTAAPEEEGDEDEVDEDEVEEDDEDDTGGEVNVTPTTSASPPAPVFPTGNAVDTSVAPSGLSVDTVVAPQMKDPCTDPACALEYDPLLDTEGYIGDDPQAYMVDQQKSVSQNPQIDTLTDKQTLIDAPAGLTSELNSALKSANVLSNALVSVEVPSESRQSSSGVQTQMTDSRTALKLEGTAAGQQSLNTDLLSDPSAASATLSPQSDATTAAPEEEGDEDEVDEDEVEEDDEDDTGGEVNVTPTTSASPPAPVFPTGNAVDTSVAPSGLSVDTVVAPQMKDPCTDPACALEYDPLLDTEGYIGDDPQAYMVDQQKSVSQNPQIDTLTDKQTLIDAPAATLSPQPDATTAAAGEEEGDDDEVDEDEIEEDDEDETGSEVTPSVVTPEVSPTITAAPPVPILPTVNAVVVSVPSSGIPVDVAAVPQLNDPLLDTEGYVGDDPLSYMADQPAFPDTQANTLTDAQAVPDAPAGLTSDLNNIPGALGISSTAATSVEILVFPSNVIEVSIELESPNTGPGPAINSQESVEAGLQSHITGLPSDPSGVPVTQAPQPNSTTIAVEEEEKDEDEDEDEDESVLVNPSDVSLQAGPIPDTPGFSTGAAVSAEAPLDSSLVSAEHSPVSGSLSVGLPVNSVEISAESAQLPSDPSAATTDPQPTMEEDADEDEEDEDETGNATQVPPALAQVEPLSLSSSTSVSADAPSDSSQISLETIPSNPTVSVELPSNSSEVSLESGVATSVSVELPLNSSSINMEVANAQAVLVSVSIEANSAPSFNLPIAPNNPSAVQTEPGTGDIVMERALSSSEERLAEQEKVELALNTASDLQVNTELAVANPWTKFLHSLGTRTPPQPLQQRGPSNTNLSVTKTGITKPLPAKVTQSSSEEN